MIVTLALAASLSSAQPATQPVPTAEPNPIVVEGERRREEKIVAFIKALTPAPIRGQLSRFESPICPSVEGIADQQQANEIVDRIRHVAAAVGVPVARPGCTTNLAVFITHDKQALLEKLARWDGMFPEEWSGARIRDFERDQSPVAAWQTESEVWQDGFGLGGAATTAPQNMNYFSQQSGAAGQKGGELKGHSLTAPHAVATRLKPSARPVVAKAVVVIKAEALAGLTPVQVADYAAMRTLVRTDPKELTRVQADTILGIIDAPMDSAVPQSLTAWDLSFLKAFYASATNKYAEYQRAQMKVLMKQDLDKDAADGR
jgi:hypothetical protein